MICIVRVLGVVGVIHAICMHHIQDPKLRGWKVMSFIQYCIPIKILCLHSKIRIL